MALCIKDHMPPINIAYSWDTNASVLLTYQVSLLPFVEEYKKSKFCLNKFYIIWMMDS